MLPTHQRIIHDLADRMSELVRSAGPRVLHLMLSSELRRPCLELIADHELHPDNTRGFLLLDEPSFTSAPGWRGRIHQIREQHARRQRALREQGEDIPALGDRPDAALPSGADGVEALAAFGAQLAQLSRVLCEPLTGWMIVIAPSRLESPKLLARDLDALLANEALAPLRWIVAETDAGALSSWASGRSDAATHDARLDARAVQAEARRMLDAAARAPAGATSHAIVGAAWPDVAPPPRREQSHVGELDLPVSGGGPGLDPDRALRLRNLLFRASLDAVEKEKRGEVLDAQRRAVALCVDAGWSQQAALCEATLAAYHVRYGEVEEALVTYRGAADRAEQAEAWDVAVAADLSRAAVLRSQHRGEEALDTLLGAVRRGRAGASLALLLETWRQAAEIAQEIGAPQVARRALTEAVEAARKGDPAEVRASCAGEVARALADMQRRAGEHAEAERTMDVADALEGGG